MTLLHTKLLHIILRWKYLPTLAPDFSPGWYINFYDIGFCENCNDQEGHIKTHEVNTKPSLHEEFEYKRCYEVRGEKTEGQTSGQNDLCEVKVQLQIKRWNKLILQVGKPGSCHFANSHCTWGFALFSSMSSRQWHWKLWNPDVNIIRIAEFPMQAFLLT